MLASLPASARRIDRLKAVAALNLNSTEAQRAVNFLKEHRTVVDPTLVFYEFISASTARPLASFEPGVARVAPELAKQFTDVGSQPPPPFAEEAFAMDLAIVAALHRAGVPIVAGTDQTVPGHSLHREIELYTQAGFTHLEAIQAATIVPARVMGLDKELETVEVGKRADLILLGANPLDDIRNIRKVEFVVTDGRMYNCAGLWRSVDFKP